MDQESSDCIELGAACKVLVKNAAVQSLVKKKVGEKQLAAALALMRAGKLEGPLGDKLHDFLSDTIENQSEAVWSGLIPQEYDEYPVNVMAFHGVFWVQAMEYDPIGYFLSEEEAISFARSNWDDVYEEGEEADEDEDDGLVHCPFCNETEDCDHLLVRVDVHFRDAIEGPLWKIFNRNWAERCESEVDNPDFDEREAFDELLEEVNSLADSEIRTSPDSAPGISTTWAKFYCSSKRKTNAAVKKFSKP